MRPVWRLVAVLYPFATGAMMLNLFFLSLLLGWVGIPIITPWTAVWASIPLGLPPAWIYARHLTRLRVRAGQRAATRPVGRAIRSRLVEAMGRRAWFSIYGIVAPLVTAWIIAAASRAAFSSFGPNSPGPAGSRT